MTSRDRDGRYYAPLSSLAHGSIVSLDGGFTCHEAGTTQVFKDRDGRLFFKCSDGKHYLESQDDGDGYCVGVYHG